MPVPTAHESTGTRESTDAGRVIAVAPSAKHQARPVGGGAKDLIRQAAGERELAASRNEVVAIDKIELTVTGRTTQPSIQTMDGREVKDPDVQVSWFDRN